MINGHMKNYAKRRGFEFDIYEMDGETYVDLFEAGDDNEPMVIFIQRLEGLQLKGFVYNKHLNEDFPALITTAEKLKEVLNYFQAELTKGKQ